MTTIKIEHSANSSCLDRRAVHAQAAKAVMRAYLAVVSPRPPGNIQARQRFQVHGLPRAGETVRSEVRCLDKQVKRERFYVDLQVQGSGDDGRVLYTAVMSLIWAR